MWYDYGIVIKIFTYNTMIALPVFIGSILAFSVGVLWFRVLFKKPYTSVIPNKDPKFNKLGYAMRLLALFIFAANLNLLHQAKDAPFYTILSLIVGSLVIGMLAWIVLEYGNKREAVVVWLITASNEVISIAIIVATLKLLAN